ncbi:transcriptional regulator, AlpA family [Microbulbifer yueqingensis]|uniref:Transcriptional regulator, AlpA family n=1 Tax=Microbulbifer yueqingensis TaxID=658219 RepID=A0A1G9CJ67_9GAMM|nr:transcriptional regulator, AlpA family [Microbulbifer yueqingensis]
MADYTPRPLPQDPDAFCRAKVSAHHLGIGLSTFWLWVQQGKIAPPIKLSPRVSVWRAGYIRDLQRKLVEGRAEEQ